MPTQLDRKAIDDLYREHTRGDRDDFRIEVTDTLRAQLPALLDYLKAGHFGFHSTDFAVFQLVGAIRSIDSIQPLLAIWRKKMAEEKTGNVSWGPFLDLCSSAFGKIGARVAIPLIVAFAEENWPEGNCKLALTALGRLKVG